MSLDPADRLGMTIKRTEVALMAAKTTALREFDLTVAQYAVLLTLREQPGITGAGLARVCMVTPQAITPIIAALERRGLVQRDVDDWNRVARRAHLTDEGTAVTARADQAAGQIEQRVHDALTAEQRDTLRALLALCDRAITHAPAPQNGPPGHRARQ